MELHIESMRAQHWPEVRAIYLAGIATGDATFETQAPDWDAWANAHLLHCSLVARLNGSIAGWASLSPVSGRCVYAGVAEVSLYVHASWRGNRVGRGLLEALVALSERQGIWTLQAGVFPENRPSLALHRGQGFRDVGRRERIGKLDGRWRDVLLLERRSSVVGID